MKEWGEINENTVQTN